jgi:hypothetical protein
MRMKQIAVTFFVAFASACAQQNPVAPASLTRVGSQTGVDAPSTVAGGSSRVGLARSPFGGSGIPLVAVSGSVPAGGAGTLNDPQTGEPGFNNFELNVNVHGGPPDTDLYFQFVADIVPGTRGDGICLSFPSLPGNTIGILHTSPGGAASAHLKFEVPEGAFLGAFDSGVASDWQWRVVNAAQTFDLRTSCTVLTGK